jgi:hypothetical protein
MSVSRLTTENGQIPNQSPPAGHNSFIPALGAAPVDVILPQLDIDHTFASLSVWSSPAHGLKINRDPSLSCSSVAYDCAELFDFKTEASMCWTSKGIVKHVANIEHPHRNLSLLPDLVDKLHAPCKDCKQVFLNPHPFLPFPQPEQSRE